MIIMNLKCILEMVFLIVIVGLFESEMLLGSIIGIFKL